MHFFLNPLSQNTLLFLTLLKVLIVISFFPSFKLTHTHKINIKSPFPSSISPGQVFVWDKAHLLTPMIDGKKFSQVPHRSIQIGGSGFKKEQAVHIHGVHAFQKAKWWQMFTHPQLRFFDFNIEVKGVPLTKGVPLKLPTKVWSQVNDLHQDMKKQQKIIMKNIFSKRHGRLKPSCWDLPLKSVIVSKYASPRRLPNGHAYRHSGVDLRGSRGTPVYAAAQGLVRYSGHMIVPGNIIVIDHGEGVFTRYMHLNKRKSKKGDFVKPGELIGYVGSTGRSEAPHLHWEVIWKGNYVDPHSFVQAWGQPCDLKLSKSSEPIFFLNKS